MFIDVITQECEVGRNVTRAHVPLFHAMAVKAIEPTRRDVVLGIGNVNVFSNWIYRNGIRDDDILVGAVGDEVVAHLLTRLCVDHRIGE